MKWAKYNWRGRLNARRGASLVEYAIILCLIAAVAFLVLQGIGTHTSSSMEPVSNALQ